MSFPSYPEFRPLDLADKPLFDQAFSKDPPVISEFTFTNLYSWRASYGFMVSLLDDLIIVRFQKNDQKGFLSPLGTKDKKAAIKKILGDTAFPFIRVPEEVKSLFPDNRQVTIQSDEANDDYVYLLKDLIELPGRKYDGKRNLIKKFKSSREYQYVVFTKTNISDCLLFAEEWCVVKNCGSIEGLTYERQALKEMVDCFESLNFIAGGIRIGEKLSAIAFAETLNPATAVMHILKADAAIPGLYQAMMHEMLVRLKGAFTYVNLEQDLGMEGLRKSKRSYYPYEMIHKYTLKPVNT